MREKLSACGNSSRTLALRSKVMSGVQCIIVSCGTRKGRKLSQSKYHSYHRPLADFTSVKKTKETDGVHHKNQRCLGGSRMFCSDGREADLALGRGSPQETIRIISLEFSCLQFARSDLSVLSLTSTSYY